MLGKYSKDLAIASSLIMGLWKIQEVFYYSSLPRLFPCSVMYSDVATVSMSLKGLKVNASLVF